MIKKIMFTLFAFAISLFAFSQDTAAAVEDAREGTGLRADGKIYVVLLVSVTILIGLIIYLVRLDRKISRLEGKNIQ
jgi:hypothetical protein